MTRILGAILAGGQSRRFGSDKALALWEGETLLDRVVASLGPQVDALVVCGRAFDTLTALPDRPGPDLGPLGGLNAALHYAFANGFDAVVSVPCDTPILPADLVARLTAQTPCYVASIPVIGHWPAQLAERLDHHLATAGKRSMRGWIDAIDALPIAIEGIANINSPGDLATL
jgi:molybdopterin-guanine dinucleotide biosynthesis protein A